MVKIPHKKHYRTTNRKERNEKKMKMKYIQTNENLFDHC